MEVMHTWIIHIRYIRQNFIHLYWNHILNDYCLTHIHLQDIVVRILTRCISGNPQRVTQLPPHMCTHLQSSKIETVGPLVQMWPVHYKIQTSTYRVRLRSLTGKLGRHHDIFLCVRRGIPTVLIGHVVQQEHGGVPRRGMAPFGLKSVQLSIGMLRECK